jgi:hypothetical protein
LLLSAGKFDGVVGGLTVICRSRPGSPMMAAELESSEQRQFDAFLQLRIRVSHVPSRIGNGHGLSVNLGLPVLDLGEIEDIVDDGQQRKRRVVNDFAISICWPFRCSAATRRSCRSRRSSAYLISWLMVARNPIWRD